MLTDKDVESYREQGYIVVPDVLGPEEVAAARREIEAIIARARFVRANDDVFDLEDSHTPEQPRVRRIKLPHKVSPFFWDLVHHPKLVAILQRLLGPSIRLQSSKLNMKAAGYGAPVEWHQDWAFYPHTNDDVLAVGVMLDDVGEDNGPMMVLPGTHKGPVYDHHSDGVFSGGMDPNGCGLDFSKVAKITGTAGSMSFHHVRLVHGSDLNRSGRDRRFLLYEVTAADAWPLMGTFSPFESLEEYDSRIIAGEPTTQPRLAPAPVRLPLPKPTDASSIYQAQKNSARRYFETYQDNAAAT